MENFAVFVIRGRRDADEVYARVENGVWKVVDLDLATRFSDMEDIKNSIKAIKSSANHCLNWYEWSAVNVDYLMEKKCRLSDSYGFVITNPKHTEFVGAYGCGSLVVYSDLRDAKVFSSPHKAKEVINSLGREFKQYTWVVSELGFANEHNLELATLREENAKLKEERDKLKRMFNSACIDVGKFANRNIDLRKEVKDYKERTAALQRQLDEAAADRWEAQTKLTVKEAEFNKLLMNSVYGLRSRWSDLTAIDHVIFNDPATIVFWKDGTKTIVKNSDRKKFDPEKGLAMAICKKLGGNKGSYYDEFKKWLPKKDVIDSFDKYMNPPED